MTATQQTVLLCSGLPLWPAFPPDIRLCAAAPSTDVPQHHVATMRLRAVLGHVNTLPRAKFEDALPDRDV